MAYDRTDWVDDSDPPIDADNLNKIETGMVDAHQAMDDLESSKSDIGHTHSSYVLKAGDTMTGDLTIAGDVNPDYLSSKFGADMGGNRITSLADPTEAEDAATKGYVDTNSNGSTLIVVSDLADIPPGTPVGTVVVLSSVPPPPTSDRPVVVGWTTHSFNDSLTLSIPAGTQDGDLLVTFITNQSAAIATDYQLPAGWSRAGWPFVPNEAQKRYNAVFVKVASGESDPYTWVNALTTGRAIGVCVAVRGGTTVSAWGGPLKATGDNLPELPVVAVPEDDSLALGLGHTVLGAGAGNDARMIFPAPWTEIASVTNPEAPANVGVSQDAMWVGQVDADIGNVGGQKCTTVSGGPAADAGCIIVIGPDA